MDIFRHCLKFMAKGAGIALFGALAVNAQDAQKPAELKRPVHAAPPVALNLQKAIDGALRENLSLVYQRYAPASAAESIQIARAEYDPKINFSTSFAQTLQPLESSTLDGSQKPQSESYRYNFNIAQKLPTGGQLLLQTNMSRSYNNSSYSTLNPDYSSGIGLEARQPVLKGAGFTVNLATIASARSLHRQSELELRKKVLDTILAAEIAYWDLSAAYAFRDLRKSNIELAQRLLNENTSKYRLGLVRRQDVIQAEANLAAEEEEMILAEQLIDERTDALLSTMGELRFDENAHFSVSKLPEEDFAIPEFKAIISGATAFDLDLQITMEIISRSALEKEVADQNLNPTLNLVASASLLGRDGDFGGSYDSAAQAKGHNWSAGLEFSMPWDLREERARYSRASIALRQSQISMAQVQQTLMLTLRGAYRNLQAGAERKKTTLVSLRLNEESFRQQKALYDAGLITFRDVLQAQRDLDLAKRRYLDSVYSVVSNNAKLSRLDGSIFERHGFSWKSLKDVERPPKEGVYGAVKN